jgi:hypothetical protein
MIHKPAQWPSASGVFNVPRTVVMTTAPIDETRRGGDDTVLVATPLDLIRVLEGCQDGIVTVVLTERFAADPELSAFLRETYPRVELVVERARAESELDVATQTALVA